MSQKKQTGPLQNLFNDVSKILDYAVFKNKELADSYETESSRGKAELYILAMLNRDSFVTYKNWWTPSMFRSVTFNVSAASIKYYMEHPYSLPLQYRDALLIKGREAFLDGFVEENTYYRMLMGLPALDDNDYIYLSDELQELYGVGNIPVHELSVYIQNKYIETDEYVQVVADNPDKEYLLYLGKNKIDLYTSRNAKDFEIIRYPLNRTDINPYVLNEFQALYADSREYIMMTLYNKQFEDLYTGYRGFMGCLIMSYALMLLNAKAVECVTSHKYLDDTMIYIILSMYNIPDSLLMTTEVRRKLAIHIMQLIQEKGTNAVYYDIIKILGYQDVIISKLMLMKGQKFVDGIPTDEYEPYFLQLDLKDKNPYETIANGLAPTYTYDEIVSNDLSWMKDDPEVDVILKERKYSEADSKYIVIEATIHQMKSMFETIYFSRLIIDNLVVNDMNVAIPEIFGTDVVSIYDCMIAIICAMCMINGLSGELYTDQDKLLATAGFNFDIDIDKFMEFVYGSKYLDKDWITNFISNLSIQDKSDISRVFSDVMSPMREWLEDKIATSVIREEYLEYEAVYRALFTYDISRNRILDNFDMPINVIAEKYGISTEDMNAFRCFYPNKDGKAVMQDKLVDDGYYSPFLRSNQVVDYCLHINLPGGDDRGYLYLYELLNCTDARALIDYQHSTAVETKYIFLDYYDGEVGYEVNQAAVNKAIELIDAMDDDMLKDAYFQVDTIGLDGTTYEAGDDLPASIVSTFKRILLDKLQMDIQGLSEPPTTYFECLERKNPEFYAKMFDPIENRFNTDRDEWMNDVNAIIVGVENELSMHVKYLEQSAVGQELFFQPLITLIKHFKSMMVDIAKTGIKYIFDDKMDAGGNSNMLKLFDSFKATIHFTTLATNGYASELGLFDAIHKTKLKIQLNDRTRLYRTIIGEGFAAEEKIKTLGSVQMVDEMKFYRNGKPIDDPLGSMWYTGEPNSGRWSEEDDVLMRVREKNTRIYNAPVDLEGWKDFVPSYNPIE